MFTLEETSSTGTLSTYYVTDTYTISFEMVNYTSYELPESGGVGAIWFRLGGIAAILLAGWLLIMRYNERKRAGAGGAYLARAANWEMNRKVHDVTNTGSEPEAYPLGSEGGYYFRLAKLSSLC